MDNFKKGYEAGLNGWRFDLELADNKEYLDGWSKGCAHYAAYKDDIEENCID